MTEIFKVLIDPLERKYKRVNNLSDLKQGDIFISFQSDGKTLTKRDNEYKMMYVTKSPAYIDGNKYIQYCMLNELLYYLEEEYKEKDTVIYSSMLCDDN